MSTFTEDDIELKDMVTQLLDSSGVLGKMKAQLRAHVYTALESSRVNPKSTLLNPALKEFLQSTSGRLILCLVREFLEFFQLDFTLAVFDPETCVIGKDLRYKGRSKLIDTLGLTELVDQKSPLLSEIMRLSKVSLLKSESPTPTDLSEEDNTTSNQPSLAQDPSFSQDKNAYRNYKECTPVDNDSLTPDLSLNLEQGAQEPPSAFAIQNQKMGQTTDNKTPSVNTGQTVDNNNGQTMSLPQPTTKVLTSALSLDLGEDKSEDDSKELSLGLNKDNDRPLDKAPGGQTSVAKIPIDTKPGQDPPAKISLEKSPTGGSAAMSSSLLGDLPPFGANTGGGGSSSVLGNLPPLGGIGLNRGGDLPPLQRGKGDLPPLSAIPKGLNKSVEKKLSKENSASTSQESQQQSGSSSRQHSQDGATLSDKSQQGGVGQLSQQEKEESQKVSKKQSEPLDDYSVSEDIAEDLDSFSSQSNASNLFTKEEAVVNSDSSLKADHVESL